MKDHFKVIIFSIFGLTAKISALEQSSFGRAVVSMLRNNGKFPIKIDLGDKNPKDGLYDQIPNNSSFKIKLSNNNAYLKIKSETETTFKLTETTDASNATVFLATKDFAKRSFILSLDSNVDLKLIAWDDNSIGLSTRGSAWRFEGSSKQEVKIAKADQYSEGGYLGKASSGQSVIDSLADEIYFSIDLMALSRITKDFLGQHKNPQILAQAIFNISNSKIAQTQQTETYLSFLASQLSVQKQSDISKMSQDSTSKINQALGLLTPRKESSSTKLQSDNQATLFYGDTISIISANAGTFLSSNSTGVDGKSNNEPGQQWTVLGVNDWQPLTPIKSGDSIRLLNESGKFLCATPTKDPMTFTLELSSSKDDPSTQFLITSSENSDQITLGRMFFLTSAANGAKIQFQELTIGENITQKIIGFNPVPSQADIQTLEKNLTPDKAKNKKSSQGGPSIELLNKIESEKNCILASIKRNISSQKSTPDKFFCGYLGGNKFTLEQASVFEIIPVRMSNLQEIAPGATYTEKIDLITQSPILHGYSYLEIPSFDVSSYVTLPPMDGKGAAWYGQAFGQGKAAFSFVAKTNSNFEVVFGREISEKSIIRLQIGSQDGQKISLVDKNGKVLASGDIPRALTGVLSGRHLPFWVNYDNGTVSVGLGKIIGQSIFFLASAEEGSDQASRFGFCSSATPLTIALLKKENQIAFQPNTKPLVSVEERSKLSTKDLELEKTLRFNGHGRVLFKTSLKPGATFKADFRNDQNKTSICLLYARDKASDVDVISISDGTVDKTKDSLNLNGYQNSFSLFEKSRVLLNQSPDIQEFWIDFSTDFFSAGIRDKNFQTKITTIPTQYAKDFKKIFVSVQNPDQGDLITYKIYPETKIIKQEQNSESTESITQKVSLLVVKPFEILLSQSGPSIKFVDKISNKSFFSGKATSSKTDYQFIMAIDENGFADATWLVQPENAERIAKNLAADVAAGAAAALNMAASNMESADVDDDPDEDPDGSMDNKHAVAEVIAATASVGASALSIAAGAAGTLAKASADYDYNKFLKVTPGEAKGKGPKFKTVQEGATVFEDKAQAKKDLNSALPQEVKENISTIAEQLSLASRWSATTMAKYQAQVSSYLMIVRLINHPAIMQDSQVKGGIITGIESIIRSYQELGADKGLSYATLELLLSVLANPYIFDPRRTQDLDFKAQCISALENVSRSSFLQSNGLTLPTGFKGFVPLTEIAAKKFEISLELSTNEMAKIGFGNYNQISQSGAQYVICISNSKVWISFLEGAQEIQAVSIKPETQILDEFSSNNFFITFDGKTVSLFSGKKSEKSLLLDWTDPYPWNSIETLYLGSAGKEVVLSNLLLAYPEKYANSKKIV